MKILLIGCQGQVGWELRRSLLSIGEVIATSRIGTAANVSLDLSNPEQIRTVIGEVQPQLIVNAAAYTAVEQAEQEPEKAMAINAIAPGIIARSAQQCGAAIIHYSTDYVFDGTKETPYKEGDLPNPLNVYGRTKLAGEQAIQAVGVPHFIFRTSWVYGMRGQNFLLTMLRLAKERERLTIVDDQIGAPTWCRTIADVTAQILAQGIKDLPRFLEQNSGLYHLTSTHKTSWYGFANRIFELTETEQDRALKFVQPTHSENYPSLVKRPQHSLLEVGKLERTFGLTLPDWDQSLILALDN